MRNLLNSICILILFIRCTGQHSSYETEIKQFQYKLNTEFADASTSPLTSEDIKTFKKLDFFPIDKKFKVEASLELTPFSPVFEMKTTSDRLPLYKKYGVATFTLEGKKMQLNLYQNQQLLNSPEYGNLLFVPFNDTTNGSLSYGGGRYIDIEIPTSTNKTIIIDFNKAYNPYCAYNHSFSCPIPPSENNLKTAILAGVKAYNKH